MNVKPFAQLTLSFRFDLPFVEFNQLSVIFLVIDPEDAS